MITLFLLLIVFHIAWYFVSRAIIHREIPDERTIKAFHESEASVFLLNEVKGIHEERYLDTANGRLHLDILPHDSRGNNRPTLVFIPGTSVYAQFYLGFMHAMYKEGFNVVAFDPRGHGRSSGPRGDYTINTLVDDALSVCAYAKKRFGDNVAISGSSQGGMAAFYTAARDNSLRAAVCHNLADLNGKDNLVLSRLKTPAFLVPLAHTVMQWYLNFALPTVLYLDLKSEYLPDGRDAASFLKKDPLAVTWITFRALDSLMLTRLAKPVEKITVPVMVVH
jgi:pimeloyl-ACP methyl ester carboxylesterase